MQSKWEQKQKVEDTLSAGKKVDLWNIQKSWDFTEERKERKKERKKERMKKWKSDSELWVFTRQSVKIHELVILDDASKKNDGNSKHAVNIKHNLLLRCGMI